MDSTSATSRPSHERQTNTHKENNDASTHYKSTPIGNNSCVHDNPLSSSRSPDTVGCWGDVPKRQTCLADLFHTTDEETMAMNRPNTIHTARLVSRTMDRCAVTSDTIAKSSSSHTKGLANETKSSSEGTDQNFTKNSNGTGRERLLEWLRTSQAKRDENNRQVFTRWIDRIDSMNNQETINANLSSAATLASCAPGYSASTLDFPHNSLFTSTLPGATGTNGTALPGLLAPTAFFISNPLGMLCTPGLNTINTISPVKPNTLHQNSLNNPYLPTMMPGRSAPMNPLTSMTPVQPSLITLATNSSSNQTDKSHSEGIENSRNESETNKSENGSQSTTNLNLNSPARATYGTDTNNVTTASSEDMTNGRSPVLKAGPASTESVGSGSTPLPLNTVYFPPTVPMNTMDPSMVSGSIHPSHYYVPMPLLNDPLASQMYYYYYCQNQMNNPATSNPNTIGTNATNKPLGFPQQWICYVPGPSAPASFPTTAHSLYMPDNCMCVPACSTMVDPVPYELSNRRPEESKENSLNMTTSTYSPLIQFPTGCSQTLNAENTSNSNQLNLPKPESLVKMTTNGCLLSSEVNVSDTINADQENNTSTIDFDTKQWYSVLQDIANPHGTDCARRMKTSKNIDSLTLSTTNSQSLILEKDTPLGSDPQTKKI